VGHVNRIKGPRASQGIYDYEPMRKDRLQRLEKLHTGDGRPLAPRLKAEIVREIKRLECLLEMIATVEIERRSDASQSCDLRTARTRNK